MRAVTISWCGNPQTPLGRVVLGPTVEEADQIRQLAKQLGIPVIDGQTDLMANDLWVGISPKGGFGDLAGETMWARTAEGVVVVAHLKQAKVFASVNFREPNKPV